jgi:hypothetical protein
MVFAQESIKRLFADYGDQPLSNGGGKKGTIIFTGTLGALRCNVRRRLLAPSPKTYSFHTRTSAKIRSLADTRNREPVAFPRAYVVATVAPWISKFGLVEDFQPLYQAYTNVGMAGWRKTFH